MDKKQIKSNFHKNWLKQLEIGEREQDRIWYKYLNGQANKIIDEFLANNKNIQNIDSYYTLDQFEKLYIELYKDIGLRMANWYMNNYEKYIKKQDASQFQDIWSEKFAFIGKTTAGERIVSVSGNRKKELIKYIEDIQQELIKKPLSIFDICPDVVDTEMTEGMWEHWPKLEAKEVAECVWLCFDKPYNINKIVIQKNAS